jgi:hypothetical protein
VTHGVGIGRIRIQDVAVWRERCRRPWRPLTGKFQTLTVTDFASAIPTVYPH